MDCYDFYLKFIENLSPRDYSSSLNGWEGDIPWVVIFSSLGRYFANDFPVLNEEKKDNIFSLIKLAMEKESSLSTSVATGLLEALHKASMRNGLPGNELIDRLDMESSRYLAAWVEWSGLK
ncbi:hypothetical protein VC273_21865 [Xanthomonas nasturtii]|uniref:hypothetical protein n=1 Tax=Xanthomonas TaxID=338 RepID=UPI002B235761|nr:hypothetical protein [Xanthomonas nasturtii]MEA9558438.1 hypothetical protein [Xanthomonas nasturtii]